MRTVTINIDAISSAITLTNVTFDAEFETITSDDTQCRIWINRYERMIRKLQAGSAALRMADDDALGAAIAGGDNLDGMDGMGDINGDLLTAMAFDTMAKEYARTIAWLEHQDRTLRGVVSNDDDYSL